MHPSDLIPAPDTLQVPWGWFQLLLSVTFLLHLLFMNAMLGGAVIAFWSGFGRGQGEDTARTAAGKLPFAVAFAVNAGVAPLLFLQVLYGHFVYASSIVIAAWWLAVIGLLIVAYYAVYLYRYKFDAWAGVRQAVIGLAALLLLVIAFLFVNNWTLAVAPERWSMYFARPNGTSLNLGEPTLWPRYLHMVGGSLAVAGLLLALFAAGAAGRGDAAARARVATGLAWFNWATVVQVGMGLWWLLALRSDVQKRFMGGDPAATGLLALGLGLAVVVMVLGFRGRVRPAAVATLALLLTMVLIREIVRAGYLAPVFSPSQLKVEPQVSPLILFLAVFVVGIASVVLMLRLGARAGKEV